MHLLGIDIGSSSVKVALLRNGRIVGETVREKFPTRSDGLKVEVDPGAVLNATVKAVQSLGKRAKTIDLIALDVMAPSWVAMDANGKALTPIVTHQDRRSVDVAQALEDRIGKDRHLQLAGNRPIPGGISSTTFAWYKKHEATRLRRVDLVGHLSTFLHRQWTNARVIDPSNASFTGLYSTLDLSGWNDELCENAGIDKRVLPEVMEANQIGGKLTTSAARQLGLKAGTPMLAGIMDGSCAMLLAGAKVGQVLNVSGSTDVLAVCTDRPVPHEKLLTRALGVGNKWLSVSTLAAAGSALNWTHDMLFPELSPAEFFKRLGKLARNPGKNHSGVTFDPSLAGDRASIDQPRGAFHGLTLSTTRDDLLSAVVEGLARASAARLTLLQSTGIKFNRSVLTTGGVQAALSQTLHRDWPGKWTFRSEKEATLRGLATLATCK